MSSGSDGTPHVPITRRFRDLRDEPKDPISRRLLRGFGREKVITWADLLLAGAQERASAVVLVAPSDAGKSTEVNRQAERLRGEGTVAFVGDAGAIACDGLREVIGGRDFDEWLLTSAPAVLFVDAIDELHLRQRKFSDVTRRLARDIDFATRTVQLVISARTGAWSPTYRTELVDLLQRMIDAPNIREVTFEPIDVDDVEALAAAAGVQDVGTFRQRFEEHELYTLLDLRPSDVKVFAGYWTRHGNFGSWTEILREFVEASLTETNPAHHRTQDLSLERGVAALRRIAAASVMMKQPHVTVPPNSRVASAIDGRRLLADWEGRAIDQLFANALLVHKGDSAVQLPQGALTQYLAAGWFAERIQNGWRTDDVRDALCVRVADEPRWRVSESRRAVFGWLASEVPSIRTFALEVAPEALLYEGDPSKLTGPEIGQALRSVLQLAAASKGTPWPTPGTVRQLARPEVSDVVLDLLREFRGQDAIERHLFRYAELGRYSNCVPHALEVALDAGAVGARATAIAVVAAVGSAEQVRSLLPLAEDAQLDIRTEILEALVPAHLRGPLLVKFLVRSGDFSFRHRLGRLIDGVAIEDVEAALDDLRPRVDTSPGATPEGDAFEAAIPLLLSRLRRAEHRALPDWIGQLVIAVETHMSAQYLSERDRSELVALIDSNVAARRAAWECRLSRAQPSDWSVSVATPQLGRIQAEDVGWLHERAVATENARLKQDVFFAISSFYASSPDETRASLRAAAPGELASAYDEVDRVQGLRDGAQRERAEADRRRKEELRTKSIAVITPRLDAVRRGEAMDLLVQAWRQLDRADTARGRLNVGQLRDTVGEACAAAFESGFKACWRRQNVDLPKPGENRTPIAYLAGLTGLTLEVADGLNFSMLSPDEAELAGRYALYELNAFPFWIEDLLSAHPAALRAVLEKTLEAEWLAKAPPAGVLRFAPYAPRGVGLLMRSIVLRLLGTGPPGNPSILREAANALLLSTDDAADLARRARAFAEEPGANEETQCAWLRVWAHVEPQSAADWLEALRQVSSQRFEAVTTGVAALLEGDVDPPTRTALGSFLQPPSLERWITLLHAAVSPESDVDHDGAHTPTVRDDAQGFRRRCVAMLAEDSSVGAHMALRRLRHRPELAAYAETFERASDAQTARAAEAAAVVWDEAAFRRVEAGDERLPASAEDLFRLVRRHISRVADLIQNDEFSYRELLRPETPEPLIQRWVASSLRLVSSGLYSVVRENEVDPQNEVDISALAGPLCVPIEIKPVGSSTNYSLTDLSDCIATQLYEKYMRPPHIQHGVLLLVRHKEKEWRINGTLQPFHVLVEELRGFASAFGAQRNKVIVVETIDALPMVGT